MSSIIRRMKRKNERDLKKGIITPKQSVRIPTKDDVEEYILDKTRELRINESIKPINNGM